MADSATTEVRQVRPLLAAALAIVVPGLGHIYIRMWGRALLWFALYFLTMQFFVPDEAIVSSLSLGAVVEAVRAVPLEAAVLVITVSVLNVVDAYLMAKQVNKRHNRAAGNVKTCPHCGKELDEDLDFCHWCTTELETEPSADGN